MKLVRKNAPLCIVLAVVLGALLWWIKTPTTTTPVVITESEISRKVEEVKTSPAPVAKPAPLAQVVTPQGSTALVCPTFTSGIARGAVDTGNVPEWMHGNVGRLQVFLATRYGLDQKAFVDGIFGPNTEAYVKRYQKDVGLPENGIVDASTREKMLSPCVENAAVNGKAFPKRSVSFHAGDIIVGIKLHEAIQEQGRIEQGGSFRIELMSLGGVATIRVTGGTVEGIGTEYMTLSQGEKKSTNNWPVGLLIELQSLTAMDANFAVSMQSTD